MIAMTVNEQVAAARAAVEALEAEGVTVLRASCDEDQERPVLVCLERSVADRGRELVGDCRIVWRDPDTLSISSDAPAQGECRICGCTELEACIDLDGLPCFWVAPGLCSACARGLGVDVDAHRMYGAEADVGHASAGAARGEMPR